MILTDKIRYRQDTRKAILMDKIHTMQNRQTKYTQCNRDKIHIKQHRQNTHKAIQIDKIDTKQNTQTKYKMMQKRQNTYTNQSYKVLCLVPEVTGI